MRELSCSAAICSIPWHIKRKILEQITGNSPTTPSKPKPNKPIPLCKKIPNKIQKKREKPPNPNNKKISLFNFFASYLNEETSIPNWQFLPWVRQLEVPERSHVMWTSIANMVRKVNGVNKTWLVDDHSIKHLFYIVYTCFTAGGK